MKDAVSQNTNVAKYCKWRKSNMISLFKQNQLIKRHMAFIGNIILFEALLQDFCLFTHFEGCYNNKKISFIILYIIS